MLNVKSNEYTPRYTKKARAVVLDGEGDDWRAERLYIAAYLLELNNSIDRIDRMADHEGGLSVWVDNSGQRDPGLEKEIVKIWEILNECNVRICYIQSRDMNWHEIG